MTIAEQIFKEVQGLPDELAKEVLDFVEYLEARHGLRDQETQDLTRGQAAAMDAVWNNKEDDVWNDV